MGCCLSRSSGQQVAAGAAQPLGEFGDASTATWASLASTMEVFGRESAPTISPEQVDALLADFRSHPARGIVGDDAELAARKRQFGSNDINIVEVANGTAHLTRNGAAISVPAVQVVVGDIVHLKAGDVVPADGVVLAVSGAATIKIHQSCLTGESFPVPKPVGGVVYGGCVVNSKFEDDPQSSGATATMLVCAVGPNTMLGGATVLVLSAPRRR